MNPVIEMKRPTKSLNDFLDGMSEDDLVSALDAPVEVRDIPVSSAAPNMKFDSAPIYETNSRLALVKMFEQAPEFEQPFTFCVRKYTGEAFIQAMRTTLAKARKIAKDENYELGVEFKLIKLDIQTKATMDIVTVTRIQKGKKHPVKLSALAKLMGGSNIEDDEDD